MKVLQLILICVGILSLAILIYIVVVKCMKTNLELVDVMEVKYLEINKNEKFWSLINTNIEVEGYSNFIISPDMKHPFMKLNHGDFIGFSLKKPHDRESFKFNIGLGKDKYPIIFGGVGGEVGTKTKTPFTTQLVMGNYKQSTLGLYYHTYGNEKFVPDKWLNQKYDKPLELYAFKL